MNNKMVKGNPSWRFGPVCLGMILIFSLLISQLGFFQINTVYAEGTADYGDAPAPYPTTNTNNGAHHEAVGPTLGTNRDVISASENGDRIARYEQIVSPENDDLVDAIEITSLPYTNSQSTTDATLEIGEPDFVCAPGIASVWYKFTPGSSGLYDVDTFGSAYDTVLHVYENEGGGVYSPLSCDDDFSGAQSRSIFYGVASTEYFIGVIQYETPSSAPDGAVPQPIDKGQLEVEGDIDGAGGDLTLSVDSYSCPADAICATVFDHSGLPLVYPDLHVYTTGGSKVDRFTSMMGGYVESDSLSPGTYNVDLTGANTFISESGWSLGYQTASAESLPRVGIRAKDRFGISTIAGEVWLRSGETNDWVGWFLEGDPLLVYATPGTYDVYVQDWRDRDYYLLLEGHAIDGEGGSVILNAQVMPLDTVTYNWDDINNGAAFIPVFDNYLALTGEMLDGHTFYVSIPDTSYTLGAKLIVEEGVDRWHYSFFECCEVTGSPGQNVSFTVGGTLTTTLAAVGDPYYPGDTGSLMATVQDSHSNLLGAIDFWDKYVATSPGSETQEDISGTKRHPVHDLDQVRLLTTSYESDLRSTPDGALNQSAWFSILPDYLVEDALSNPISGSLAYSSFTAPYEFDIPDPTNMGTWQGEVWIDFGEIQPGSGISYRSVSFDVLAPLTTPVADFDGDGDTDISVYRPSNGRWYIEGQGNFKWGLSGDLPVPGDYDGDGIVDIAIFRPSNGKWYVAGDAPASWGTTGDIPLQADYTGDGLTDKAVLRTSTKRWYIEGIGNTKWYFPGDIPVPCDYDGDGSAEIAIFRPSNNNWYVVGESPVGWGQSGDIPVPADYDGDGSCDMAVFRPSNGKWYVNGIGSTAWGQTDDIPVPGDYDGDGDTEYAVLRPSNGKWYIKDVITISWYASGDFPLPVRDTNADGDPYE
jgi:hypothetical protein